MAELTEVLAHYGIKGEVVGVYDGPLVRQIEFRPEPGTKLKNIAAVLDDAARELGVASLRAESLEDSQTIGFELPQTALKVIDFESILASETFKQAGGALPINLGVDIRGNPVMADLAKMPHLLVGGTTGSGKSVGLNSFILSLIARKTPEELKLVLIDPKKIEFSLYNNQKYLWTPVVSESDEAAAVLAALTAEMDRRYGVFEESMSKNIGDYNKKNPETMLPYIVCVIDEFADLIAVSKKSEKDIQRLAQKARAAGIHLILATQRPSVDVVTGVLKANFPSRLAYKTAGNADSRTILDSGGAEKLLGRGDALYLAADGEIRRVHGAYVSDEEIAAMLVPYRGKVKARLPEMTPEAEKTAAEKKTGWLRGLLNFWSSLRQREKKTLISGIVYLFGWLAGKNRSRR